MNMKMKRSSTSKLQIDDKKDSKSVLLSDADGSLNNIDFVDRNLLHVTCSNYG